MNHTCSLPAVSPPLRDPGVSRRALQEVGDAAAGRPELDAGLFSGLPQTPVAPASAASAASPGGVSPPPPAAASRKQLPPPLETEDVGGAVKSISLPPTPQSLERYPKALPQAERARRDDDTDKVRGERAPQQASRWDDDALNVAIGASWEEEKKSASHTMSLAKMAEAHTKELLKMAEAQPKVRSAAHAAAS